MMKDTINKILNIQEVDYSTSINDCALKEKIELLSDQSNVNLSGQIQSNEVFTASDKQVVIGWSMPNLKRRAAYLKGQIFKDGDKTYIKLKVNPNTILPIFGLFSMILGFALTFAVLFNSSSNLILLSFGLSMLFLGLVYYPLSIYFRNRLRNKFVNHLGLIKVQ